MLRPTLLPLALAVSLAACGDDGAGGLTDTGDGADASDGDSAETGDDSAQPEVLDTDEPDADTNEPDTTVPDTADTTDTTDTADTTPGDSTEPGPPLVVERFGARLWGPIIQMSQTGRLLWLGTRGNPDPLSGAYRAGLYRIDLDTGVVRHYEDELPLEDYSEIDPFLPPQTFGPTPTAGVQGYDSRYLAVAHTGLLLIDGSSVTPFPLSDGEGAPIVPVQLAMSAGASPAAWLTSDRGLLRLDPDTFDVLTTVTGEDLSIPEDTGGDFGKLAVDPDSGAVYASYFATTGTTYVVRGALDGAITLLEPGTGGLPDGRVGDIVWSGSKGVVYIALGAWNANEGGVIAWDGTSATEVVREGALGAAHTDGDPTAFGAQILALDDAHGWLAVGGQVQSGFGGSRGGGLVVVDVASDTPRLVGMRTKTSPLYHWHTNHLIWDSASNRLYVAISDLCSEVKLRNRGLFALSFDDEGEVRYERPILSGVRAVGFTERDDTPWLGLRDDNGGLACDSYPIQTGFGHVQSGGSYALTPLLVDASDGMGGISLDPGVTALDVHAGAAIGTYRDGFFLGRIEGDRAFGYAGNQALLGPSLFTEDVIHEPGDVAQGIWIAGRTTHSNGDPPQLADRGPRGVALVTISGGVISNVRHYVRGSEDLDDIVGLPSGEVHDLHREPDGSVIAACAAERVDLPYDRSETPIFEDPTTGEPRMGGIARLDGANVEVLAGPEITPDPRALTRDDSGRLVVADALRGVLRLEGDTWVELELDDYPKGAIPQAIWAGAGEDLAVATSMGLWVRIGGRVLVRDDVGFAWSLAWRGDRLYAGTDVGLVVVKLAPAAATIFPAPPKGVEPPFPAAP